jgi:hypothetical protein
MHTVLWLGNLKRKFARPRHRLKVKILQGEYGRHHEKDQMWVLVNKVTNLWKREEFLDCLSNH